LCEFGLGAGNRLSLNFASWLCGGILLRSVCALRLKVLVDGASRADTSPAATFPVITQPCHVAPCGNCNCKMGVKGCALLQLTTHTRLMTPSAAPALQVAGGGVASGTHRTCVPQQLLSCCAVLTFARCCPCVLPPLRRPCSFCSDHQHMRAACQLHRCRPRRLHPP
jgi:hypothetical protein